jgi:hydrogenase maturation protease
MRILVIGYGNLLRGDDGVGAIAAETVASWNLPGVRTLSLHQLTPELADDIAQAEVVFFIDACVGQHQVSLEPLQQREATCTLDHVWSPASLLSLAKTLYSATPIAYQILIPATEFDYGAPLSAIAEHGLAWSLERLKVRLEDREVLPCMRSA